VLVIALPPLLYVLTKRICLGLQRSDREKVLHGTESGRLFRTETGEYFELHEGMDARQRWVLVQHDVHRPIEPPPAEDANGVRRKGVRLDRLRYRISRFYFEDRVEPVTPAELSAASHEGHGTSPAIAAGEEESATGIASH
jgi:ubiquinol-cytochrome c reductase cytochrome b subunit